jgi:ZIP family zinc transporter
VDVLTLLLAGTATALATGLGAIPVFLLGDRAERLRPVLWGIASGVMAVASIFGLLLPALDEGSTTEVGWGVAAGVAFLLAGRAVVNRSDLAGGGTRGTGARAAVLVFAVLLVHSLPEGFAIGTAYASNTEGLALFVFLAIAIQNIPEGTSVAIPMQAAGESRSHQFWAAVASSVPQPIGALVAYWLVEAVEALLPFSFGFAAGAMLALVVRVLLPDAFAGGWGAPAAAGLAVGAAGMLVLSVALNV